MTQTTDQKQANLIAICSKPEGSLIVGVEARPFRLLGQQGTEVWSVRMLFYYGHKQATKQGVGRQGCVPRMFLPFSLLVLEKYCLID